MLLNNILGELGTYDCLQFKVLIEPCNAFQVRHTLFVNNRYISEPTA